MATSTYSGEIVADPARDYRWKRYILVLVLLGYGLASLYDGFVRYPRENAVDRANGIDALHVRHPGFDIQLNQGLGVLLPPLSILFLAWILYNSRGCYRLEDDTLHVPGHPPIPLSAVRKINRAKWDRKGIAYVEYQIPGTSKSGQFKLDDFIYRREPTDRIFEAIENAVSPGKPVAAVQAPPAG